MNDNNKLETISNLFQGKEIRSIWDAEKEEYYFSVVDVIKALTDSNNPNDYWYRLKKRMTDEEKSEISTKCRQLKLKSKDGKSYATDTLDTKGILRLIESVPSSKAEPFKLWLAQMGKERIDEIFDPELAIKRAIDYYRNRGYSDKWIEARLKGILDRNKLTDVWKENGIKEGYEFAILTNEIYQAWSGMKASEYKDYKNIRKESLRDNMTDVEVALTDLGEIATRELAKKHKPQGLKANRKIAKAGGEVAKTARDDLEQKLGESIISSNNRLNYQYLDEIKMLEDKNETKNKRAYGKKERFRRTIRSYKNS
ncbi:MAG: phage antirepressor protein [Clostridia bacterium]|nr:phage antirepressor protein [Clostridia bacterium]